MTTIKLGDIAKDKVTGFTGVVVAQTTWLNNCVRLTLQPTSLSKDGAPRPSETFDEYQVELVKRSAVPGKQDHGGPAPAPTRARDPR